MLIVQSTHKRDEKNFFIYRFTAKKNNLTRVEEKGSAKKKFSERETNRVQISNAMHIPKSVQINKRGKKLFSLSLLTISLKSGEFLTWIVVENIKSERKNSFLNKIRWELFYSLLTVHVLIKQTAFAKTNHLKWYQHSAIGLLCF